MSIQHQYTKRIECPHCNLLMKQIKTKNNILIDVCEQCWGIWLDGHEHDYADLYEGLPVPEHVKLSNFQCPRCEGDVEEFWYQTSHGKLLIDKCKECDGIWLDNKKELNALKNVDKHQIVEDYVPDNHVNIYARGRGPTEELTMAYAKLAMMEATREERKDYYKERLRHRRHRGLIGSGWRGWDMPFLSRTARKHQAEIDGQPYFEYPGLYWAQEHPQAMIVAVILLIILFLMCGR